VQARVAHILGKSEKDVQTSLRLPAAMYEGLSKAATERGTGIGEEIRARLEESFALEVREPEIRLFAEAIIQAARHIEPSYGSWCKDPFAFAVFKVAINTLLTSSGRRAGQSRHPQIPMGLPIPSSDRLPRRKPLVGRSRWPRSLDTGEHIDPNRMTVPEWLTTWLDTVRQEVSSKTHERYGEIVNQFLTPALGNLAITKLAPAHIQDAYNALTTGGRRDGKAGGLSPRTRRHIHRILSVALSRAVEQQIIARNPAEVFRRRLPKVEHHMLTTLTAERSARLLDAVRHSHIFWPVLLALATGARRGEVLALRWRTWILTAGRSASSRALNRRRRA
jgi:hypothetical protein